MGVNCGGKEKAAFAVGERIVEAGLFRHGCSKLLGVMQKRLRVLSVSAGVWLRGSLENRGMICGGLWRHHG